MMDAATMRRLLTDRDAGALSEDVVALLEFHVASDASAAVAAREHARLMDDARAVLSVRDAGALPAFPKAAVAAGLANQRTPEMRVSDHQCAGWVRRANWVRGLAAAACVMLAFLAGRQSIGPTPGVTPVLTQVVMEQPSQRANGGIWSLDASRRAAYAGATASEPALKWATPLEWSVARRM